MEHNYLNYCFTHNSICMENIELMKKQITNIHLKRSPLLVFLLSLLPIIGYPQLRGGLEGFKLLDLKVGYSIPVGNYAATGKDDFESGYAEPGFALGGGYYHMFRDVIGLGGSFGLNFHGYDKAAKQKAIYDNDPTVTEAYVESSHYTNLSITVGPVVNARLSENMSFLLHLEAGVMFTFRPSQEFEITNQDGTNSLSLESITGTSLAANFGIAFRYHATERTGFSLYADYFYGNPKYDYLTYQYPNWIEIQGNQDIMYINVGMSLTYIIGY